MACITRDTHYKDVFFIHQLSENLQPISMEVGKSSDLTRMLVEHQVISMDKMVGFPMILFLLYKQQTATDLVREK